MRPPCLSAELQSLDLAALEKLRHELYDVLSGLSTAGEVVSFYRERVLPLEREFIWREREQDEDVDLVFISVGAQADTPISAGLRWKAKHVVFLHTDHSKENASIAARELGLQPGAVSLESVGTGDEALELYRRVKDVWQKHGKPANTVVDFTGGFKTMSASAGAIAFVMGFRAAYVATRQEKFAKQLVWLDTRVRLLESPLEVFGDVSRQVALELLKGGRYREAVAEFLDLEHKVGERTDTWYRLLAEALASSDAMALQDASDQFGECLRVMERDGRAQPNLRESALWEQKEQIKNRLDGCLALKNMLSLSDETVSLEAMQSDGFLDFILYLIRRAEDRAEREEFDFAAMFAYRALEAISQRRLAKEYGYHISDFDWERLSSETKLSYEEIRKVLQKDYITADYKKVDKGTVNRVIALVLKDPLISSNELRKWDGLGQARNNSVLAHGMTQIVEKKVTDLLSNTTELFKSLLKLEERSSEAVAGLLSRHAPFDFS